MYYCRILSILIITNIYDLFRYFCMGNALVVNLIEHMGLKLHKIIQLENNIDWSKEVAVGNITI